jgi:hypothetical protein
MPGHSRSKNGVLSHAYVPGIHAFSQIRIIKDVDGSGSRVYSTSTA